MNIVKKLWFADGRIFIETSGGEQHSQPLRFFPRLSRATDDQRAAWRASPFGLHWPQVDEDISLESFSWRDDDPLAVIHGQ